MHPQLIPLAFTVQQASTPSFPFAQPQEFFVTLPSPALPQKPQSKVVLEFDYGYMGQLVATRLAKLRLISFSAIFRVKIAAAI